MKARHTLLLLACAVFAPPAHADDSSSTDVRTQAAAFFAKKDAASQASSYADFKALADQSVLPTFTLTLPSKQVETLSHMMARMKQGLKTALPETADKTTIVSLIVHGSTATDINTNYSAGPFVDTKGIYGPKGARHQFTSLEHEQVNWVKQGSDWKVASVKILSEKGTVDGKPQHDAARPPAKAKRHSPSPA